MNAEELWITRDCGWIDPERNTLCMSNHCCYVKQSFYILQIIKCCDKKKWK